jgi:hypothetical protein
MSEEALIVVMLGMILVFIYYLTRLYVPREEARDREQIEELGNLIDRLVAQRDIALAELNIALAELKRLKRRVER